MAKKKGNGAIKIERGIPIPTRYLGRAAALRAMKPGDSAVLEGKTVAISNTAQAVFGAGKYAVRRVDQNHVRLWRTK